MGLQVGEGDQVVAESLAGFLVDRFSRPIDAAAPGVSRPRSRVLRLFPATAVSPRSALPPVVRGISRVCGLS